MDLFDSKSEEWKLAAVSNNFGYLEYKAKTFLELGLEKYLENDAFEYLDDIFTDKDIELIKKGAEQLLEGKGVLIQDPFLNLKVSGFNLMFSLFHYTTISRNTTRNAIIYGEKGLIDSITFEHLVDGNQITYHHFISRSSYK